MCWISNSVCKGFGYAIIPRPIRQCQWYLSTCVYVWFNQDQNKPGYGLSHRKGQKLTLTAHILSSYGVLLEPSWWFPLHGSACKPLLTKFVMHDRLESCVVSVVVGRLWKGSSIGNSVVAAEAADDESVPNLAEHVTSVIFLFHLLHLQSSWSKHNSQNA